jgi:hypothetical protein
MQRVPVFVQKISSDGTKQYIELTELVIGDIFEDNGKRLQLCEVSMNSNDLTTGKFRLANADEWHFATKQHGTAVSMTCEPQYSPFGVVIEGESKPLPPNQVVLMFTLKVVT